MSSISKRQKMSPSILTYERFLMGKNLNFIKLFEHGVDTDVILHCGLKAGRIHCHKFILALHSPVFASILTERLTNSTSATYNSPITINLPDDNPNILEILIGFFYFDQELQSSSALEVIQIAHKYDCPHIVSYCSSYIEMYIRAMLYPNVFFALEVYRVSCLINCSQLIGASNIYINANITSVISSSKFLNMDRTDLIQFLEDKTRQSAVGDLRMFHCIYNWTNAECQRNGKGDESEVAQAIRPLWKYVRIPQIRLEVFTAHILCKNLLTLEETIEIYQTYSKSLTPARPVLLDVCDLIEVNYSRRLFSVHSFKFESSNYAVMNEVQFTYDETCSSKDNNKQVLVGVRIDGVDRFYTNDPENPFVVKFEPELTIPHGKFIDIFWSDKYVFSNFSDFSPKNPSFDTPVRSSTGHVWIFRSFDQNQLDQSDCPLKFLRFL